MALVLTLLVIWLGLVLLFAAGTIFLQGYFNELPPALAEVAWRAPLAGTLVGGFLALWAGLAVFRSPDTFNTFFEFSGTEDQPYFPKLRATADGVERDYLLRKREDGRPQYRSARTQTRPEIVMPARPEKVEVEEDGDWVTFHLDVNDRGDPKVDPTRGTARWVDGRGRNMEEGFLGQITVVKGGRTLLQFLLAFAQAAVWFAAFGPVLRFGMGQAVALTAGAWLTTSLFVMPPVLAGGAGGPRPPPGR